MGDLYVVSTPIGNLEDITLRALRVLKEVDRIACEDTRRTRTLLAKYDVETKVLSYHDHNKVSATRRILKILENGGDVALVSDAGTPTIADPGLYLIRAAIDRGHGVIPLPGASVILPALVVSGLSTVPFLFHGYLPKNAAGVRRFCEYIREREETVICLDSPKRLGRDLAVMAEVLSDRRAVVARELTKIHEEFKRGHLESLSEHYGVGANSSVKGEVVILVEGCREKDVDTWDIERYIQNRLAECKVTSRDLSREIVEKFGIGRNRAYKIVILEMDKRRGSGD
jgi:16S rRNA (cytidine1402-2'-O)-methyltransferase